MHSTILPAYKYFTGSVFAGRPLNFGDANWRSLSQQPCNHHNQQQADYRPYCHSTHHQQYFSIVLFRDANR
jgi:hypothetical protein